jgi:ABC-type antimicrobial peptide transport system permease subunit
MIRFVWSQMRGRAGRSVALLAGVLAATTGFTVLTGATATARLQVTGTVEENARAAYDILVRPKGSRLPLETDQGLVRPNALSGLYGGITMRQYEQVRTLAGVDVAAPIAMVGYGLATVTNTFDLTDALDPALDQQVIRIDPTFTADRGLSRAAGEPSFVYVTKHRLSWAIPERTSSSRAEFTGGEVLLRDQQCRHDMAALDLDAPGGPKPICWLYGSGADVSSDRDFNTVDVARWLPDGRFERTAFRPPTVTDRLTVSVRLHLPVLLAAIDPDAEARLVGLPAAVDAGRYLAPTDRVAREEYGVRLPVLASSRGYLDETVEAAFSRLPNGTPFSGVPVADLRSNLRAAPRGPQLARQSADVDGNFRRQLADALRRGTPTAALTRPIRGDAPRYERAPDGTLVVGSVPANPGVYRVDNVIGVEAPWQSDDTSYRALRQMRLGGTVGVADQIVGTYDPEKLAVFGALNQVPMETYRPPGVTGADQRSRDLLGGRTLLSNGNPGGYVAAPPPLLTSLAAVTELLPDELRAAPVSAIRVRVAGVTGFTKTSRERVRLVAEQIATQTGLDVDITYGSSAAPQTVELAAGAYGRPALRLTEGWSKKGVAAAIVNAVDRKSAVLFLLVLVVCTLFLVNAVSAAVRDRRSELAVLACLGWSGRRIGLAVLAEVVGLGFAAGLLGLAIAAPLGWLLGVRLSWGHALLAVPIALGVTLVAGAIPAGRAARAHPAAALRPSVSYARRRRRRSISTVFGLALTNLRRVPGRTLLGAVALAIGVAALTMLSAVTFAFRGAVVGTVLGDVVSLRVRGVDTVAIVVTVLFGAVAVADVLYLNIRDRAHELASLRAAGWTDAALARLVTYEGLCIGVLGGLLGAGAGVAGASWLVGRTSAGLVTVGVAAGLVGVLVAAVAARVPALLLRRLPVARLLAEE